MAVFTVIRRSGDAMVFSKDHPTLEKVFDHIFQDQQSGGSNYDRPNMLFQDGLVIVESGLSDLVWKLVTAKHKAMDVVYSDFSESIRQALAKHTKQGE